MKYFVKNLEPVVGQLVWEEAQGVTRHSPNLVTKIEKQQNK